MTWGYDLPDLSKQYQARSCQQFERLVPNLFGLHVHELMTMTTSK